MADRMSEQHKAALAEGREHGRTVRKYLDALSASAPRRGRRPAVRSRKDLESAIEAISAKMESVDVLTRLHLSQERLNLQRKLAAGDGDARPDLSALEEAFVQVAAPYGQRKGITRAAWREVGVPSRVLDRANIPR